MNLGNNFPFLLKIGKYLWWTFIDIIKTSCGTSKKSSEKVPTIANGCSTKLVTSSNNASSTSAFSSSNSELLIISSIIFLLSEISIITLFSLIFFK